MVVSDHEEVRHPQGAIGRTQDSFLARCVFTYRGDPNKVKASIMLEGAPPEGGVSKVISLPAEPE